MANSLWLVRHGETEWSRLGKHTGRADIPLTDAGKRGAEELLHRLAGRAFALVLTSPLIRARETCRLAGFEKQGQPVIDLAEWDYGIFEGRTSSELQKEFPNWSIWETDVPRGETIEQVAARAERVIQTVSQASGDVLVFSHGHFLRILAARWLNLPPQDGRLFALDPGCLSVLGYEAERRVLRLWNDGTKVSE